MWPNACFASVHMGRWPSFQGSTIVIAQQARATRSPDSHLDLHKWSGIGADGRKPLFKVLRVGSYPFLRSPYFWAGSLTFLLFIPVIVVLPTANDLFVHAATIEQLKANFWSPRDPMVNEPGAGNPYFSPYMVFWALLGNVTGLDAFGVLRAAAALNVLLLLWGIRSFTRTFTSNRWAPVASLAAVFFLWGTKAFYWSGFISLAGLVASVAYPSTFSAAVGLLLCSWVSRCFDADPGNGRRMGLITGLILGGAAVLMSHQFTALGIATYGATYALRHWRRIDRGLGIGLLIIGLGIAATAWLWPWYNLFTASGGVASFNAVHRPLYENLIARYCLLLLVCPVLVCRLRKDRADPLSVTILICFAAFVYGGVSGNYFLARVFPMAALLGQVSFGIAIVHSLQADRMRLGKIAGWTGILAFAAGAVFQSGFINMLSPGSYPPAMAKIFGKGQTHGSYSWITKYVSPGDTIMTTTRQALIMAPGYGIFTVMPVWPDPVLGEVSERRINDSREFFRASTTESRRGQLMRKYAARWVIVADEGSAKLRADPNFVWIGERPEEPNTRPVDVAQRHQLFEYVARVIP